MQANTQEAGADIQENGFFSSTNNLQDRRFMSQSPSPEKMGDLHLKTQSHISVEAEIFRRRDRGTEQKDQGKRLEISPCAE